MAAPGLTSNETQELAPWVRQIVDLIQAETTPTRLPYVPEITLRLAPEAVPLWTRIERELNLQENPPTGPSPRPEDSRLPVT